jgi:hypothetical protein
MMSPTERKKITFEERVITAFISAIAAALTLFGYFVINLALASKGTGAISFVFSFFFSKISAYIIGAVAIVGFFVGIERMSELFSSLWGTSENTELEGFQKVGAILIIVVIAAIAAYLLHGSDA